MAHIIFVGDQIWSITEFNRDNIAADKRASSAMWEGALIV